MKIYKYTEEYSASENYGLVSQMRRAAGSIPSNIMEGKKRGSDKEYKRFLLIARGSLEELKYQVYLSKELKYLDDNKYNKLKDLLKETGKMINGLIVALSN